MVDRRLLLQRQLEHIIGPGDWIGLDVEDLTELETYEIPETAKVGDFMFVEHDSGTLNNQRSIRKVIEDPETHILSLIETTRPVYFQPPANTKMEYPCVIFHLSDINLDRADNIVYRATQEYELILVDGNPDSAYVDVLLSAFGGIQFDRFYISDNLNHWSFSLFY